MNDQQAGINVARILASAGVADPALAANLTALVLAAYAEGVKSATPPPGRVRQARNFSQHAERT